MNRTIDGIVKFINNVTVKDDHEEKRNDEDKKSNSAEVEFPQQLRPIREITDALRLVQ